MSKNKIDDKLRLTASDIEKAAKKLVKKLSKYEFRKKKTLVIGIGRGGLIPAQYVAYGLGIRDIQCIQSKLYDGKTKDEKKMSISGIMMLDYESYETIIVVDDLIDSGTTMDVVINVMDQTAQEFGANPLIVPAALYSQEINPEAIIGIKLRKNKKDIAKWIEFPWDVFMEKKSK